MKSGGTYFSLRVRACPCVPDYPCAPPMTGAR